MAETDTEPSQEEIDALKRKVEDETNDLAKDAERQKTRDALEIERAKLSANAIDRASTAVFAVCVITPLLNLINGQVPVSITPTGVWLTVVFCFFVGGGLHLLAREALEQGYKL